MADSFPSFYLQRATREFAGDLDALRAADDFKPDSSVPFLVHALQQGAGMYGAADRERVMAGEREGGPVAEEEVDEEVEQEESEEAAAAEKKKDKKDRKKKRKSEGR